MTIKEKAFKLKMIGQLNYLLEIYNQSSQDERCISPAVLLQLPNISQFKGLYRLAYKLDVDKRGRPLSSSRLWVIHTNPPDIRVRNQFKLMTQY